MVSSHPQSSEGRLQLAEFALEVPAGGGFLVFSLGF